MTQKRYTEIPKRQKCINKEEPYIGGAGDIIDDELNKTQSQVNNEILTEIGADNVPNSIKGRVKGLEDQVGEGGTVDERIEAAVAPKANSTDVYAKTETYNKTELNNMITTPNQKFVSVVATDQTTAATDVLPATGEADTLYRVGNWDGSQFDASVYSEYAWNGSAYVHLNTKTQIGEVFDISAAHATGGTLATYADLAAALGTNGANIPQSLRKGGMSVKFVQSSDNKYVQYRLMASSFSTDVTQWQGVDKKPISGSKNFVESGGVASITDQFTGIEKELTYYTSVQRRAYLYGEFKNGDKVKLWADGTGVSSNLVVRYDDITTNLVTLSNNAEPITIELTQDTDFLVVLLNDVSVTTQGTFIVHADYSYKLKYETDKEDINNEIDKVTAISDAEYINLAIDDFKYDYFCYNGEGGHTQGEEIFTENAYNAKASDIFRVSQGDVVTVKKSGSSSYGYSVVAYDKYLNVLPSSCVSGTGSVVDELEYTVPAGVSFVRFCDNFARTIISVKDSRYTAYLQNIRVERLASMKDYMGSEICLNENDFIYRYYCKNDGTEVFDSDDPYDMLSTHLIKVKEGDVFETLYQRSSTSLYGIVAYDDALDIVSNACRVGEGSSSHAKITYTVPAGVSYILFTHVRTQTRTVVTNEYIAVPYGTVLFDSSTDTSLVNGRTAASKKFACNFSDTITDRKITIENKKCYGGYKYMANKNLLLVFYNKWGGYCGYENITDRNDHVFPKQADSFRVEVLNTVLDNTVRITLRENVPVSYGKEDISTIIDSDLGYGVHIYNPSITNSKFRLYTEFSIDSDVNVGVDETKQTLLTLKNGSDSVKVVLRKKAVEQLVTGVAGLTNPNVVCKYPLPDFHSGFGYETTGVVGAVDFADRTLPAFIPLCGEEYLIVRYKGVINSTKDSTTNVTTNITSVLVSVSDNAITFSGTVGENNISINSTVAITSAMTAQDLVDAINSDVILNDYIEAKAVSYNADKLVYGSLLNCNSFEIVTTSPDGVNNPATDGTSSIACPMYLFSKIDKNTHSVEIMSDGVNTRIVVDGQNAGEIYFTQVKGSNNNPTSWLNEDILPILNSNMKICVGGDEGDSNTDIDFKLVRIDVNTNADAEAAANGRIVSDYNPLHSILMGHGTWDGPEIDGGVNGQITIADLPANCVKDLTFDTDSEANMACSTGRLQRIAKTAMDEGFEWVNPAEFNNINSKKRAICATFDDFRIGNYYKTAIRQGFILGMVANYAIERMVNFITDATIQHQIDYLEMIGWRCFIHGCDSSNADKICKMTYEGLYTDDPTVNLSIAKNLKEALDYNINQSVWIYSGGSQTPNGLMAMKHKGINLGFMTQLSSKLYKCRATNPLYYTRTNIAERQPFCQIENAAFSKTKLFIISELTVSADTTTSHSYKVTFNRNFYDFALWDKAGIVVSATNSKPTLSDTAYYTSVYLPATNQGYNTFVDLSSGVNYLRPFVVFADGTIVYGNVTEYTV